MFYNREQLQELGQIVEGFDSNSIMVIVASADTENNKIDFNLVTKMPPDVVVDSMLGYIQHLKDEHMDQMQDDYDKSPREIPNLKVVE